MELKVQKRDLKENLKKIRKNGDIPAVYYGKEEKATSITVNSLQFSKVYKEAGRSSIVNLNIDGDIKEVVVKSIDYHPVKDTVTHVDFYVLVRGQEMEVEVAFDFIGTPKAINNGNIVNYNLTAVHVKTMPKDLPEKISISIEELENIGDAIALKDIKLPKGVSFVTEELTDVVVSIAASKTAEDDEESNSEELEIPAEEKESKE